MSKTTHIVLFPGLKSPIQVKILYTDFTWFYITIIGHITTKNRLTTPPNTLQKPPNNTPQNIPQTPLKIPPRVFLTFRALDAGIEYFGPHIRTL